nr:MAG TPA: hypothetical protein [Caudoviricetes sp.]
MNRPKTSKQPVTSSGVFLFRNRPLTWILALSS